MSRDVGSPDRRCKVCGCTEAQPCTTPEGPCHWVTPCAPDYCSACVVRFPEQRLMVTKTCLHCQFLKGPYLRNGERFTCEKGRFELPMPPGVLYTLTGFLRSGIERPNKRVAEAQKHCPFFEVHRKFKGQAP